MERTRRFALACMLLPACAAAEPAPVAYRAVGQGEAAGMAIKAAKEWAAELDEVQELKGFIRDREGWSPEFKVAAGVARAAYGYLQGGRGSVALGGWKIKLDASGQAIHHSLLSGDGRLFSVGLGRRDQGWSAEAAVGLRDGRLLRESFGLAYKLRY